MDIRTAMSLAATALVLAASGGVSPARTEEKPNFTGTWEFNEEESEDMREKMRQAREQRRATGGRGGLGRGEGGGGGGRGGGTGRGGGLGRGGGGGRGGGLGRGGGRSMGSGGAPRGLAQAPARLTIHHQGDEFRLDSGGERERVLSTDGTKVEWASPAGGTFEMSAKWKGQSVVVRRSTERAKITETYELAEEGDRLVVTTEIDRGGPMPKISVRRVYDPASATSG